MSESELVINGIGGKMYDITPSPIRLAIGKRFNISPSYAYAGVEEGIVEITDIITMEEYKANPSKYPTIEEFIKLEQDTAGEDFSDDYTLWVEYKYPCKYKSELYFPVELFIEHVSTL